MTTRAIALLSLVGLLLCGPARAGDAVEAARDHFRKGQTHYALGEFEEAATEFKEAFRLRPEPAILFNIAQAMRLLGQLKQSVFYYKQYLSKKPDARNRADVEGLVDSLKLKIAEQDEEELSRKTAEAARRAKAASAGKGGGATNAGDDGKAGQPGKGPGRAMDAASRVSATAAVAKKAPAAQAPAAPAEDAEQPLVATTPRATVPAEALSAPTEGVRTTRVVGFAAMGTGLAAGAVAYLFRSGAQSSADELARKYNAGTLAPADARLKTDMESKGRLATMAAVGGAVLLVAGAVTAFAF